MKRKLIFVFILICSVICVGCSKDNYSWTQKAESSIIEMSCYTGLQYEPFNTLITDEDVEKAIDSKLYSAAEMKIINSRSNVVDGDSIFVDYVVSYQGKVLNVYNDIKFTVGEGTFDIEFEKNMLSAHRGETIEFCYLIKDKEHKLYNKTVQIEAVVTAIYRVEDYVLSDEYVSEHFGIDTVDEFVDSIVSSLEKTRDAEDRVRNAYAILKEICRNSSFIINRDEFELIRNSIVSKYHDIANVYNMDISEYINDILDMNQSEFEVFCENEALMQIQMDLAIHEIAQRENIVITNNELKECAKSKGYSELDLLKFPDLYKELESELIQEKVYEYLLAYSIKI